jgi:predicted unusual protein kinase regulating ubiquinone biosynthesis (AarF/ABC1/UbiB family)
VETSLYDQPFRLPAQFAFLGRMLGMLLGLTVTLSPRFDFAAVATPYAQQFMGRGGMDGVLRLLGVESVEALGRDLLREGIATARSLATMPRRLDKVLERAERGELHIVVESANFNSRTRRRTVRRLVRGGLNRPVPMWMPLGLIGAFALTRLVRRTYKVGR